MPLTNSIQDSVTPLFPYWRTKMIPIIRITLILNLLLATRLVFADESPRESPPSSESLQKLVSDVKESIAIIRVSDRDGDQSGIGTGFVIDSDGLIATCMHVISEGREFSIELSTGRKLPVLRVEATDPAHDLALIKVDVGETPLKQLSLAANKSTPQGLRVLAFGNPLGLTNSVVEGIVSGTYEVDGFELIQLAIPIEPGNSGGPIVDQRGLVHGIVNMKSAIDQNLGFAIPVEILKPLQAQPNPITIDRWVKLGRIDPRNWMTLFDANWRQRGGTISVSGQGSGFGGRSLCLQTTDAPTPPFDIAVNVKLDDESGAAGLAFFSDGADRHYGFYPSGGNLRFTCFRGPVVFQWQVLHDAPAADYIPGEWNRLRVRVEKEQIKCYVNEALVFQTADRHLTDGKVGLVKFRQTKPKFRRFEIGDDLKEPPLPAAAAKILAEFVDPNRVEQITRNEIIQLGESSQAAARDLSIRARKLEAQVSQLRRLADQVRMQPSLKRLTSLFNSEKENQSTQLVLGALLVASLDDPDVDVDAYLQRLDQMAAEIRERLGDTPTELDRRKELDRYLFEENGYHGDRTEYYHRANSYLNRVIDERQGLPITLSILYMDLGRRLGLQIDGVGLPGHFVVRHVPSDGKPELIDVFEKAKPMTLADARRQVLGRLGRPLAATDLEAQSNKEILSRVLNNLIGVASQQQDGEAIYRYCEALVAIHPTSIETRMLRAQIAAQSDRKETARADIEWVLKQPLSDQERAAVVQIRDALSR